MRYLNNLRDELRGGLDSPIYRMYLNNIDVRLRNHHHARGSRNHRGFLLADQLGGLTIRQIEEDLHAIQNETSLSVLRLG